jgi:cyclophilin family peptidyl-prolyl cis-trans isomerase
VSGQVAERLLALREAEQRRAASLVGEPDLSDRNVEVRRHAARALSRIASDSAQPGLLRLLGDEDPEVVAWAAYGLGFRCAETKEATVSALVARAVALPDDAAAAPAMSAIARAVGRCAADRSEATLTAWLDGRSPRARAAALALGDLAQRTKRLREETLVALLGKAAGTVSAPPMGEALYPFFRLENVSPSVHARLAEVAAARLSEPGEFRVFAIRALGRAHEAGLPGLERVLLGGDAGFSVPERVEAVRAAVRLGAGGHALLTKALKKLPASSEAIARADADVATLLALLAALRETTAIVPELRALAGVSAPADAKPRTRRVVSLVRCAAATLVAGDKPAEPLLVACDLDHGYVGKRALAKALEKSTVDAAGLKLLRELVIDTDPRTREAGLEVLATHPDAAGAYDIVLAALRASEPGVATVAAEQLAKQPTLASPRKVPKGKKPAPDKKVEKPETEELPPPSKEMIEALMSLISRAEREHDLEMLGTALDAIGALGQRDLARKIERFCGSPDPTAREHVVRALSLLTGKKPTCPGPERIEELSSDALAEHKGPVTIALETDAGELRLVLDGTSAPVAVARITELVRAGYYDGKPVHRVDPSFVAQFGAPFGDGYGGPTDHPALRCETSPRAFETLSVGVALAGRDTGSSQLFVMRSRAPHLDGDYPWIGTAEGPWNTLFEGDVITRARVVE